MRFNLEYGEYIIKKKGTTHWAWKYFMGVSGYLYLTNKRVVFEPIMRIFCKDFSIYHNEIEKLDFNSLLMGLSIFTVEGKEKRFDVLHRGEWVQKIAQEVEAETGRTNLFNSEKLERRRKIGIATVIGIIVALVGLGFIQEKMGKPNNIEQSTNISDSSYVESGNSTDIGWNKNRLHPSLRDFKAPIGEFETDKLKFRIDLLNDDSYRLSIWYSGYSLETEPLDVLTYSSLSNDSGESPKLIFMGDWHYIVELDNSLSKPLNVIISDGEVADDVYSVVKVDYFSLAESKASTSTSKESYNVSEEYIKSILTDNSMIVESMDIIKEKHNKSLVLLNAETEYSCLVIVDTNNKRIDYTQYGFLSKEVDTTISDKNKDIFWVIKTKVFNKETYTDFIGLINMNTLEGELVYTSEYPATMEADWLTYSENDFSDLGLDFSKAYEIKSIHLSDENSDGFSDFTLVAKSLRGDGFLTFYAKNSGFDTN